ncbi:hypothetical protein [Aquabacterium sp. OR-4]|uniref:hypothetical protein n=1 Tax=Aquabacterium sp. OR-4 TaxID=2978127 RepID=UPI0021B2A9F7|nr:hypothetical protein [Aquabacterium sp. OR-4]MDT7834796.1 hypothetical protein [Aquabacterium sp. OR-4]
MTDSTAMGSEQRRPSRSEIRAEAQASIARLEAAASLIAQTLDSASEHEEEELQHELHRVRVDQAILRECIGMLDDMEAWRREVQDLTGTAWLQRPRLRV